MRGDPRFPYDAVMERALVLAARGIGKTSPNPMVGAVLVKAGRTIGEGWHRGAGRPHAEIEAFQDADRRGEDCTGATLYVTLEPCCTHGRTPPCTDAIASRRIARVVVAATDPNPAHRGRGFARLRKSGIEVVTGVCDAKATQLNRAFNHWIVHRTPWVTSKLAMTLDGRIATRTGESKWITGERARERVMEIRSQSDAILTGIGTVLADDPSLTVRRKGVTAKWQPQRWVLDSRCRTPPDAKIVSDEFARERTVLVVTDRAPRRRVSELSRKVEVYRVASDESGRVKLEDLMREIGSRGVMNLLVEGGGTIQGGLMDAGLVHRVLWFYAPTILGGKLSFPAVGGRGAGKLAEAVKLANLELRKLGSDLFLSACVAKGEGRETRKHL